jgi:ATP-dependent exoDNAse (exonuclease V) beta subunit
MVPPLLHVNKKTAVELNSMHAFGEAAATFVNKQVDDVLIDNLNKTYVAMTRPRTELHIFANGTSNTVAPLLTEFADSTKVMTPVADVNGWYEKGSLSTLAEMNALREKKRRQAADQDEPQAKRVAIDGYTVNDIPLQLNVKVDYASSPSIDAGLRLHGLMSRIRDCADVDRVIDDGLKHGIITNDPDDPCGIDSVNTHVRGPILDPASPVAEWFDPANIIYSERTIISAPEKEDDKEGEKAQKEQEEEADAINSLRPDRIIRRPDGTILVIDYKSGKWRAKKHIDQVSSYIDKLRLIFPDTPIAGRLWYVTLDLILDEHGNKI